MDIGKLIEDFDSVIENMSSEQIKKMKEVNKEDDSKYKIPKEIELDLSDELLGNKGKLEELFKDYEGDSDEREVVDWGEDVGKERFWEEGY